MVSISFFPDHDKEKARLILSLFAQTSIDWQILHETLLLHVTHKSKNTCNVTEQDIEIYLVYIQALSISALHIKVFQSNTFDWKEEHNKVFSASSVKRQLMFQLTKKKVLMNTTGTDSGVKANYVVVMIEVSDGAKVPSTSVRGKLPE